MTSRVAALVAFLALASAPAAGAAEPLLPDLTQETPHELGVATDGQRFHLGFGSVIYNYGDGVLRVAGARESTSDPTMTATQLIDHTDGSRTRLEGVGEFRYVDSITHRHWHYLKASTYSLRRTDGSLARPDQKTGFCLGDRLRAPLLGPPPETEPPTAYSGIGCGYDEPDWLEIEEGIAPGHGDDYGPQLEGQFIDITKLRSGRYQLVHHVNPTGALREKSLANNASSVLIDVRWRRGMPRVTQLSRCPGSATCPVAPKLGRARATRLARAALREAFRVRRPRELVCPGGSAARVRCTWSRGAVRVGYSVARGRVYWSWRATSRGRRPVSRRGEVDLGPARPVPVERAGSVARGKVGYCPLIERG